MPTHGSEFATLHVSVEPAYSSLLTARPGVDTEFLDLGCQAEKDVDFPSTTIDTVMATHSLTGVDWLHARIPCSVELYQSISEPVRKRVLAFDSVFLLMDIWQAQGSTVERFADLVRDGFWLSHMFSGGPIRIGEAARQRFAALAPDIGKDSLLQHHRRMPAYVCVRMFKTVEALREGDFSRREYLLLWADSPPTYLSDTSGFSVRTHIPAPCGTKRCGCSAIREPVHFHCAALRPGFCLSL